MLSKTIQHIILVMFAHYKYLSHAFESPEIEIGIVDCPMLMIVVRVFVVN
jgi:hypothetical protein